MKILILKTDQKKAFEALKKAYKKCQSLNIGFYNNYGNIGAFDKDKIKSYNNEFAGGVIDNGQNIDNEFKSEVSWADDTHYFHPNGHPDIFK